MQKGKFTKRTSCRLCDSKDLVEILDLGEMPLAGAYLKKVQLGKEKVYPLKIFFCKECFLVQILDVVDPDTLFKDYRYLSSLSLSSHFSNLARELTKKFLAKDSFIVEIGSNDGVLLSPLKSLGMRVLGVDPAENVAKIAQTKGIDTMVNYFGKAVGRAVAGTYGKADAILANNVLAHIDDMHDVALGMKTLLKRNGIFVFEVHYLGDLVQKGQYDFFYNEHLSYYSLISLIPFLDKYEFEIFDVKRIPIHSGSIRVYVKNKGENRYKVSQNVNQLISYERETKLDKIQTYLEFAKKVKNHKAKLKNLIFSLQRNGKRIVGYGAAGRGNTLMNFCNLDSNMIEYIVDESPERYGRFTPGTHVPIVEPQVFRNSFPDHVLIFAWSYKNRIFEKEKEYTNNGGKFIIPLPQIRIVP